MLAFGSYEMWDDGLFRCTYFFKHLSIVRISTSLPLIHGESCHSIQTTDHPHCLASLPRRIQSRHPSLAKFSDSQHFLTLLGLVVAH